MNAHTIETPADGLPATPLRLHIGAEQIVIAGRGGLGSAPPVALPIGSATVARRFKHSPPSAAEIENAIMLVEDELLRIHRANLKESTLFTTDASIRALAGIAGVAEQPRQTLARESVEQLFNRLAAIAQGRPLSQDALPTTAEFCATLLILRELMQHLDVASIAVES